MPTVPKGLHASPGGDLVLIIVMSTIGLLPEVSSGHKLSSATIANVRSFPCAHSVLNLILGLGGALQSKPSTIVGARVFLCKPMALCTLLRGMRVHLTAKSVQFAGVEIQSQGTSFTQHHVIARNMLVKS